MGVRVSLKWGVLSRNRQTQSLSLCLSLSLSLRLSLSLYLRLSLYLVLDLNRGHRGLVGGYHIKRLAPESFRSF